MRATRPAALLLLCGLLAGCVQASPAPPAPPTFPAPTAPAAAGAGVSRPVPGQVIVENGPFTDRVEISELTLSRGSAAVTGRLRVTTDVSDLLLVELRCTFYDERGAVLGTGSFQYSESHEAHEEHGADEQVEFRVQLEPQVQVSSAVLSVPVLVNE